MLSIMKNKSENMFAVGYWKRSHSTSAINIIYEWNILDLRFLLHKGIESPKFYIHGIQFWLCIESLHGRFRLSLKTCLKEYNLNYKLSIIYKKGETKCTQVFSGREAKQFFIDDVIKDNIDLTVLCELYLIEDYDPSPRPCLLENLSILHLNQKHSDVVLSVSQKVFCAHKLILAVQSTVFQKIFEDNKEASFFTITDVNHDVLKEMLHFIYTGRVSQLKNIAKDLFVAADKYSLKRLKIMCVKQMCSNLSFENACELLIFSDSHNEEQLKSRTLIFINMYAAEVMKTNGWELLIQSHPYLIEEVCKSLAMEHELWKIVPKVTSETSPPSLCVEKNYVFTYLEGEKVEYMWTLNKFDLCSKTNVLKSPKFYVKMIDWGFFYLKVDLNAKCPDGSDNYLYRSLSSVFNNYPDNDNRSSIASGFSLKINGDVFKRFGSHSDGFYIPNCLKENLLFDQNTGLLFDNKITIYFEGKFIAEDNFPEIHKEVSMFEVPDSQLQSDLGQLLENNKYSDVTFVISGKELQAHKLILSARSEVFQAMFEHKMEEKLCIRVDITDICEKVFQKVLEFVYTDNVSNINEMTAELLLAAHKYALERLRILCINQICSNFSVENVTVALLFSYMNDVKELKDKTFQFIANSLSEVMKTSGWISMVKTHPKLMVEICEKVAKE